MISTTTLRLSPACPRRSPTSRPSAPISPTTLWCPEVRLGMCNRSMLMGWTSMVPDPPLVSTSFSTPTARVFLARRFLAPPTSRSAKTATPTPTATPGGCQFRVLIAYADIGGQPTMIQNEILAEPGVIGVDLFDAFSGTPTLQQLQQYNIVYAFSNNGWFDAVAMGNVL